MSLFGSHTPILPDSFDPSCILVYGPGKYRFLDHVKTGLGLTLVLAVVVLLLIPLFWPLR